MPTAEGASALSAAKPLSISNPSNSTNAKVNAVVVASSSDRKPSTQHYVVGHEPRLRSAAPADKVPGSPSTAIQNSENSTRPLGRRIQSMSPVYAPVSGGGGGSLQPITIGATEDNLQGQINSTTQPPTATASPVRRSLQRRYQPSTLFANHRNETPPRSPSSHSSESTRKGSAAQRRTSATARPKVASSTQNRGGGTDSPSTSTAVSPDPPSLLSSRRPLSKSGHSTPAPPNSHVSRSDEYTGGSRTRRRSAAPLQQQQQQFLSPTALSHEESPIPYRSEDNGGPTTAGDGRLSRDRGSGMRYKMMQHLTASGGMCGGTIGGAAAESVSSASSSPPEPSAQTMHDVSSTYQHLTSPLPPEKYGGLASGVTRQSESNAAEESRHPRHHPPPLQTCKVAHIPPLVAVPSVVLDTMHDQNATVEDLREALHLAAHHCYTLHDLLYHSSDEADAAVSSLDSGAAGTDSGLSPLSTSARYSDPRDKPSLALDATGGVDNTAVVATTASLLPQPLTSSAPPISVEKHNIVAEVQAAFRQRVLSPENRDPPLQQRRVTSALRRGSTASDRQQQQDQLPSSPGGGEPETPSGLMAKVAQMIRRVEEQRKGGTATSQPADPAASLPLPASTTTYRTGSRKGSRVGSEGPDAGANGATERSASRSAAQANGEGLHLSATSPPVPFSDVDAKVSAAHSAASNSCDVRSSNSGVYTLPSIPYSGGAARQTTAGGGGSGRHQPSPPAMRAEEPLRNPRVSLMSIESVATAAAATDAAEESAVLLSHTSASQLHSAGAPTSTSRGGAAPHQSTSGAATLLPGGPASPMSGTLPSLRSSASSRPFAQRSPVRSGASGSSGESARLRAHHHHQRQQPQQQQLLVEVESSPMRVGGVVVTKASPVLVAPPSTLDMLRQLHEEEEPAPPPSLESEQAALRKWRKEAAKLKMHGGPPSLFQ